MAHSERSLRVSPDFATTAGDRHMDKVKEEAPQERGDELRLAAIHDDVAYVYPCASIVVHYAREHHLWTGACFPTAAVILRRFIPYLAVELTSGSQI
ncbi:hypothetical protein Y032_0012g1667 [Ancylostoma ceylanicum]|uniref:Uncharacterized protein n=1 Tax=Ancylostoma ceylanicum TaxID=53326 RepID=A0A016VEB7_9BILA|nr:hypothetical protein Y032_0012g1667 [Ancylostoma ceylanicum]